MFDFLKKHNKKETKKEEVKSASLEASGFTTSYTDPGSGLQLPAAWINIRQINYTPYASCFVVTDIYKDFASFQAGMAAIFANVMPPVNYNTTEWNTYFDPSVMTIAGHDIQAQSLAFLEANL